MADPRAALTLRLGDKEICYEAEREAVEAQLERILGRLLSGAPGDVAVGLSGTEPAAADAPPATAAAAADAPPAVSPAELEAKRLERVYTVARGGRLRLRKLPERTADALLLVLYGMRKLQDRKWVHAPGMTSAARASGARFDRADRLLAAYQDLIEGIGNRRSRRYRLTAAGREHCARLVEDLAGPIEPEALAAGEVEPEPELEVDASGIPKKVTSKWDGELLTVTEAAERLGVDEAEVGRLRRRWELLGLPGGDRKRRRFFYPAFQIDAAHRRIVPQAREANRIVGSTKYSWDLAKWWTSVEPRLDRRPIELIGTPEADEVVRVARAMFPSPD